MNDYFYAFSSDLTNGFMMIAESDSSFYFQNFNTEFLFNRNVDNIILSVTVHAHGKNHLYIKGK